MQFSSWLLNYENVFVFCCCCWCFLSNSVIFPMYWSVVFPDSCEECMCICLSNRSILQRYSIFMLIPRFFLSVSTLFHFFCHLCCSPESLEFCLYINILLSFKMTSVSWVTITTRGHHHHHSNRKPLREMMSSKNWRIPAELRENISIYSLEILSFIEWQKNVS